MTSMTAADSAHSTVGYGFSPGDAAEALDIVQRADRAGVRTIWTTMPATGFDTLTLAAAALATTEQITMGTSIVPAFTRHPVALAGQALAIESLAPGRLRVGVGTGNLGLMGEVLRTELDRPLARLRDYLEALAPALRDGRVTHDGPFYGAEASFAAAAGTPLLAAALGPEAFALAGELTDGALGWLCPPGYMADVAGPAVAKGAARAGRTGPPPLVTQVPAVVGSDRAEAIARTRAAIGFFATIPVYITMFTAAGFAPVDGTMTDALIDEILVSGTPNEITEQLAALVARDGIDEVIVTHVPGPDARGEEERLFSAIASIDSIA